MTEQPECQPSASRPGRPAPAQHPPGACTCGDAHPADGCTADLDRYIARLVDAAPPLTSEQRDQLALILRVQRSTLIPERANRLGARYVFPSTATSLRWTRAGGFRHGRTGPHHDRTGHLPPAHSGGHHEGTM
jgi:hypothetical protein